MTNLNEDYISTANPLAPPPPMFVPPPGIITSAAYPTPINLGVDVSEGESLNQRMMALVMKLTHPEKDRQSRQTLQLLEPSRTLYINNLNEKIPTAKLEADLKNIFGKYGSIVDFVALKSFWRRGQAFIAFDSIKASTLALNAHQGQVYEGKPMRINFARREARGESSVKPEVGPALLMESQQPTVKKPFGIIQREKDLQQEFLVLQQDLFEYQQSLASSTEERGKRKAFSLSLAKSSEAKRVKTDEQIGHRILFCDHLSEKIAEADLIATFSPFQGFEKVRFIEAKRVAFVDFKSVEFASAALQATTSTTDFTVSFAKR